MKLDHWSPPNVDTLLASWYSTYMQSFIISHSSYAEQYGDMSSNTQTHTFTHIHTFTGGQERNLLVVPIVSKTMYEANYFTPSTENDHRSACCQKHGSFSGPAASIVSFNCEGLSEEKGVLIVEMCRTNSYVALCNWTGWSRATVPQPIIICERSTTFAIFSHSMRATLRCEVLSLAALTTAMRYSVD